MKRISILLAFILMLALIPMSSLADTGDVAQLSNGTTYSSLSAAVEAASATDTITLLADTNSEKITVDKNITLNLNQHKLTIPETNNYGIVIKDQLTINGDGEVYVNANYGIGLSTSCTGGLTINGGTFTASSNNLYLIGAYAGKVVINGGSFSSPYCVVNSFDGYTASAEINRGTFSISNGYTGTYEPSTLLGINFAVSGGSFSDPVPAEYCADGFSPVSLGNGRYGVARPAASVPASSSSAPKTGDESQIMLWACMLALSGAAMIIINRKRRSA